MRLNLLSLEPREQPALWHGGEFWLPGVGAVHPFEDWHGSVDVLRVGDRVYVGAGPGGGPRVATLDDGGVRVVPDYFAGDPADRSGVVLVSTSSEQPEPVERVVFVEVPVKVFVEVPVGVKEITLGDTDDPDAFVVYVDWESRPEWAETGMAALAASLPVPGLVFTTVRPNDWPDRYGEAVVVDNLDYADATYGAEVGGLGFGNWASRGPYTVNYVYAATEHSTEDLIGSLLAHEIAHGFGWQHGDDGTPDDPEDLDVVLHGVQVAKKFLTEVR
jgi:hypothetical protein